MLYKSLLTSVLLFVSTIAYAECKIGVPCVLPIPVVACRHADVLSAVHTLLNVYKSHNQKSLENSLFNNMLVLKECFGVPPNTPIRLIDTPELTRDIQAFTIDGQEDTYFLEAIKP